jgi:hypothetical protein
MSALWMNTGLDYAMQVILNKASPQNFTLRLFTNTHTPAVTDTPSSYTECALSGYSAYTFAPSDWSGSTSSGLATYTTSGVVFTFSAYAGGTTIQGYFVTIPGPTAILADVLSTPFAVPAGGGTLTITPTALDQRF